MTDAQTRCASGTTDWTIVVAVDGAGAGRAGAGAGGGGGRGGAGLGGGTGLRDKRQYDELGAGYFEQRDVERTQRHHVQRLQQLGYSRNGGPWCRFDALLARQSPKKYTQCRYIGRMA